MAAIFAKHRNIPVPAGQDLDIHVDRLHRLHLRLEVETVFLPELARHINFCADFVRLWRSACGHFYDMFGTFVLLRYVDCLLRIINILSLSWLLGVHGNDLDAIRMNVGTGFELEVDVFDDEGPDFVAESVCI